MNRLLAALAVSCGLLLALSAGSAQSDDTQAPSLRTGTLLAQAGAAQEAQTTARRAPRGRVPNNYGQLGLSARQRTTIYGIQAKYNEQLEELEKQIAAVKELRDKEIEGVLTPAQKQRLEQILATKQKEAQAKAAAANGDAPGEAPEKE